MHSAGYFSPKDPAFSVSVGVAALILEGRPHYNSNHTNTANKPSGTSSEEETGVTEPIFVAEYAKGCNLIKDAAQRINQKLQAIRTGPGTSKDFIDNVPAEIPVGSPSHVSGGGDYGGPERLYANPKFSSYSSGFDKGDVGGGDGPYSKATARSLFKTVEAWTESNIIYNGLEKIKMLHNRSPIKTPGKGSPNMATVINTTTPMKKKPPSSIQGPVQGPHCEHFLKKIGLVKVDPGEEIDHRCEYFSDMCRLWQSNLAKISSILLRNECICIEVYLGPENHAVLLEQWTVQTIERADQGLMSLQSLCSAIRSQLYFSQITAWADQLKNLTVPFPREVLENPRIIKNPQKTRARLDVLFRIRSLNGEGCFNERPQTHQFPEAMITENLSVEVCLKSLPRMSHIPVLNDVPIVPSLAKVASNVLSDERKMTFCTEKGKHRCVCDEEESPTKEKEMDFPAPTITHREKQLQKYRKRMLKREKVQRKKEESDSDEADAKNFDSKTTQTGVSSANTVGTQTDAMDCATTATPTCNNCGENMHYMCMNCDTKEASPTNISNASELLLRAIERTGSKVGGEDISESKEEIEENCDKYFNNNVDSGISSSSGCITLTPVSMSHTVDGTDCRLCKRQKTRHNSFTSSNLDNSAGPPLPQSSVSFYLVEDEPVEEECECHGLHRAKECGSPKVNLTQFFEAKEALLTPATTDSLFNFDHLSTRGCSSTPVQKSSSAPSFNYATLSPRFCRLAAAIHKRRSRHLSDRSSTSEEPLSDDESICDSHSRSLSSRGLGSFKYRRAMPLLFNLCGTLEETLLQHRIQPKHQVMGFKVLLGASGSFCPTQLALPAVSNFYELQGSSVTTPYVSEFTLPRKGYCVPRNGTIQVTLLNPLGTVVRMFVVPYDFSDMPNTSVTFIRQRILARDDLSSHGAATDTMSFNKLSSKDQMRLLRYAIHLRFKTSRSGRLYLHTDVKMLILRRPDCDTAAAHANNSILESPNELNTITVVPDNPRYSQRIER